ncbi:MAG: YjbQ family protein [Chloroflexi bacterium]|jgi:secondary thiamine-phosphate synthase enzyme|nr:YjbQ family protein [Chloroflexota bacterium]
MQQFQVRTSGRTDLQDITTEVRDAVGKLAVSDGVVTIFTPHTTAGVTINENADPDVVHDMLKVLDEVIPFSHPAYRHMEGNSAAHIKSSLVGCSQSVIVENGRLQLGTWQGIYFAEFDGPRTRKVWVAASV